MDWLLCKVDLTRSTPGEVGGFTAPAATTGRAMFVVCGVWCLVCGVWCLVCGVWCVACGV